MMRYSQPIGRILDHNIMHGSSSKPGKSPAVEVIIPPPVGKNRRTSARQECLSIGALLVSDKTLASSCLIRDISPGGARIALEAQINSKADLWLVNSESNNISRGTMVWNRSNEMGIRFNFVQKITDYNVCPPKVPKDVFDLWKKMHTAPVAHIINDNSGPNNTLFL